MKRMELETESKPLDILLFLATSFVVSEIWKEMISLSIHTAGSIFTIILGCFIGYMAKNFWLPYWFPKEGNWRILNFMNPNRSK